MKERIFTTKEQGRVLVEAGLPISTASGFRDKYLDSLHSMEDNAGRIGLIEAVTPDISNPVWDVGTLLNLFPEEIDGYTFECYKLKGAWLVSYRNVPLLGYNKKYDCPWMVVYRKGDKYYTNMKYDVEFEISPPNEYEYVYP